ncbi:UPF0042 nucleotide-binding protein [Spinactinospora alkalitolerans]|uniref:UPF0042 nucleotide-binding protein n=1 Tax=Spinactinospora alkalitolerans TaxID=687207 RepID=A0A852TSQ5_9ACTN|nr:RNase adapter RapZ [Spinactinospora alkalitolerans]NYE47049.1 UPF0042 nucleotide-binding protein [Spinactinospora alkalitolerans]
MPDFAFTSFGRVHGDPPHGSGLLVDLSEALHNPQADPAMRELTGLDPQVRRHVLATPGAEEIVERVVGRALALLPYSAPPDDPVNVFVCCQDGRHRSVAVAEECARRLRRCGFTAETAHRHIARGTR